MKRQLPLIFALACTAAFAATAVKFASIGATLSHGGMQLSFQAAGIPPGTTQFFYAMGDSTATYGCFNGTAKNPPTNAKRGIFHESMVSEGSFVANEEGIATGTIKLDKPNGDGLTCPKGQTKTLISVAYENVRISDGTSRSGTPLLGKFQRSFVP